MVNAAVFQAKNVACNNEVLRLGIYWKNVNYET